MWRAVVAFAAMLALVVPAASAHAQGLQIPRLPASFTKPPPGFKLSGAQAVKVATGTRKVAAERARPSPYPLVARPLLFGDEYWLVEFFRGKTQRVQVQLNGRTGKITGAWAGREIDWPPLAHGAHGPRNRLLHKFLLLAGLLFLIPLVDVRRLFRMRHLDLLALLSFGFSHFFAARGNIYVSTPLEYPPLVYLLVRMVTLALRPPRDDDGERATWLSPRVLGGALIALLALRYAYDIVDGDVNDVGYASVYGADSIIHGLPIYDSSPGSGHLDSYGPIAYLAYVPFTLVFPLTDLSHTHTEAARAAAIFFDLATVVGLVFLGRNLRPGRQGTLLGLALGWGFAAYPWTLFVLSANTNDGLVAMLLTYGLLAWRSSWGRGLAIGLAAAAKFAPLAVAGVFVRVAGERGRRPIVLYALALVGVIVLAVLAYLPDGGLREFYDSTIGFQFGRTSPFSMWGLHPAWKPVHTVVLAGAMAMAAASLVLPKRRGPVELAAAGAALIIAAQLTAIHWFFFYLPWFLPYALVAVFSSASATSVRNSGSSGASAVASNSS